MESSVANPYANTELCGKPSHAVQNYVRKCTILYDRENTFYVGSTFTRELTMAEEYQTDVCSYFFLILLGKSYTHSKM